MRFSECKNCPQFSLVFLVIFALIIVCVTKHMNSHHTKCDRDHEDQTKTLSGSKLLNYLGSKGPYAYDERLLQTPLPYPECEPQKLWYFGRHGTRNPGKKDTIKMQEMLPVLRDKLISGYDTCQGTLSEEQFKRLQKWEIAEDVTLATESHLVKQGVNELKGIGSRYRRRFPQLFASLVYPEVQARSTKSQRTIASALAFIQGAVGDKKVPDNVLVEPEKVDQLLKFYGACKKWMEEVDKNEKSSAELLAFKGSTVFNETIARVSTKLGLRTLSIDEITIIYTTCAFETAWKDGQPSPWCVAFERDDLQVMAYQEDLDYYWKDGYGYDINYEQACTPVQDLIEYFNNDTVTKVKAHFSHSGATLKLLARLGLFKDANPLTSDMFSKVKETYLWRSSFMDTMATNLAFVLYECKNKSEQEIGFMFQENPTEIPACDNKWHCPLGKFKQYFMSTIEKCDLNKICNL